MDCEISVREKFESFGPGNSMNHRGQSPNKTSNTSDTPTVVEFIDYFHNKDAVKLADKLNLTITDLGKNHIKIIGSNESIVEFLTKSGWNKLDLKRSRSYLFD